MSQVQIIASQLAKPTSRGQDLSARDIFVSIVAGPDFLTFSSKNKGQILTTGSS